MDPGVRHAYQPYTVAHRDFGALAVGVPFGVLSEAPQIKRRGIATANHSGLQAFLRLQLVDIQQERPCAGRSERDRETRNSEA